VVDNASTHGSAETIEARFSHVKLIRNIRISVLPRATTWRSGNAGVIISPWWNPYCELPIGCRKLYPSTGIKVIAEEISARLWVVEYVGRTTFFVGHCGAFRYALPGFRRRGGVVVPGWPTVCCVVVSKLRNYDFSPTNLKQVPRLVILQIPTSTSYSAENKSVS
jgi:hypothetical protein